MINLKRMTVFFFFGLTILSYPLLMRNKEYTLFFISMSRL